MIVVTHTASGRTARCTAIHTVRDERGRAWFILAGIPAEDLATLPPQVIIGERHIRRERYVDEVDVVLAAVPDPNWSPGDGETEDDRPSVSRTVKRKRLRWRVIPGNDDRQVRVRASAVTIEHTY